eukprot:663406_1
MRSLKQPYLSTVLARSVALIFGPNTADEHGIGIGSSSRRWLAVLSTTFEAVVSTWNDMEGGWLAKKEEEASLYRNRPESHDDLTEKEIEDAELARMYPDYAVAFSEEDGSGAMDVLPEEKDVGVTKVSDELLNEVCSAHQSIFEMMAAQLCRNTVPTTKSSNTASIPMSRAVAVLSAITSR